ncbi:MAG: LemA family protein [Acidimicrobiales bacterium]|jgi:LemA protein|nr:LemA family protein [Acidimicrobiales bacterium]MDG1845349.1 LemA family protein [Acidimicrobiales bacterium]
MAVWIVLIVVSTVLFAITLIYNKLIRLRNKTENAWAAINVQLHRRYDLIPILVKIVQGYAEHEKVAFVEVTSARTAAVTTEGRAKLAESNDYVTSCLERVFAISESYPDLNANENFLDLQEELSETENLIAYSRQYYNDVALKFNNFLQTFPYNVFAGGFDFHKREYFTNYEIPESFNIETNEQ